MSHNYLDFNDYSTPVKKVLDDRFSIVVTPNAGILKVKSIYIKRNYLELSDTPYRIGKPIADLLNQFNPRSD